MADSNQPETAPVVGAGNDELAYPSTAYPPTHPDKLAAMGRLFGLETPAPAGARVLELGCGDGANLLPMAQHAPGATFVGIDSSAKLVAAAQAAVAAAGLKNVEIRRQDILDFPAGDAKFDYILAHDVYSSVPERVRERILAICRDSLTENGVAYVSYYAFPGWGMRLALREMIRIHTGALIDPREKIRQAGALMAFLAESVPTENSPYGLLLKQEVERMGRSVESYVQHGILEEFNQPFYFHEFIQQALKADLQYLGEPALDQMLASNFSAKVQETLGKIGNNIIAQEQYMDFLRNRGYRQTLLVHRAAKINRQLTPAGMRNFFYTSLIERPGTGPVDLAPGVNQDFKVRGLQATLSLKEPLPKAAFEALADCAVRRISFDELLAGAREKIAPHVKGAEADRAAAQEALLLQNLFQLYARGVVEIHADRPTLTTTVPAKPEVTPLVRHQAMHARQITSRAHVSVRFDATARIAIAACDGTRDRDGIVDALVQAVRDQKLQASENNQPVTDEAKIRAVMQERVDAMLPRIAALGFFSS